MKYKYRIVTILSTTVIIFDLISKFYIHTNFELTESINVIPNYFNLTYIRNPGAAFGFLAQSSEFFRKIFFSIIPLIACGLIIHMLRACSEKQISNIVGLSLIMGGALGNYINRMTLGYVVDFLDFHYKLIHHWPAFNIADISIVTGIAILFCVRNNNLDDLKNNKKTRRSESF